MDELEITGFWPTKPRKKTFFQHWNRRTQNSKEISMSKDFEAKHNRHSQCLSGLQMNIKLPEAISLSKRTFNQSPKANILSNTETNLNLTLSMLVKQLSWRSKCPQGEMLFAGASFSVKFMFSAAQTTGDSRLKPEFNFREANSLSRVICAQIR